MDRQLRAFQGENLVAEINYNYSDQLSGTMSGNLYKSCKVEGLDIYVPVRLATFTNALFTHGEIGAMEAVIKYDLAELERLFNMADSPSPEGLTLVYAPHVQYRYKIGGCAIGIANISANFLGETKSLEFLSCESKSGDKMAAMQGWDCNILFIKKSLGAGVPSDIEFVLVD